MQIYNAVINLAKSVRAQNLFAISKEVNGIRLFKNSHDFSKLQEIYLNYLYTFDLLNRDVIVEGISKKVIEDEIFWESYLLYKKSNKKKEEKPDKQKAVSLVAGKNIKFPKREVK
jgi:hypothetical protein